MASLNSDLLNLMVMAMEAEDLASAKPELVDMLPELHKRIDDELRDMKFEDITEVKQRMRLPIQRLYLARKVADMQLIELASLEL